MNNETDSINVSESSHLVDSGKKSYFGTKSPLKKLNDTTMNLADLPIDREWGANSKLTDSGNNPSWSDILKIFTTNEIRGYAWTFYIEWTMFHRFPNINHGCKHSIHGYCAGEHIRKLVPMSGDILFERYIEFRINVAKTIYSQLDSADTTKIWKYDALVTILDKLPPIEKDIISPIVHKFDDKFLNLKYQKIKFNLGQNETSAQNESEVSSLNLDANSKKYDNSRRRIKCSEDRDQTYDDLYEKYEILKNKYEEKNEKYDRERDREYNELYDRYSALKKSTAIDIQRERGRSHSYKSLYRELLTERDELRNQISVIEKQKNQIEDALVHTKTLVKDLLHNRKSTQPISTDLSQSAPPIFKFPSQQVIQTSGVNPCFQYRPNLTQVVDNFFDSLTLPSQK